VGLAGRAGFLLLQLIWVPAVVRVSVIAVAGCISFWMIHPIATRLDADSQASALSQIHQTPQRRQ